MIRLTAISRLLLFSAILFTIVSIGQADAVPFSHGTVELISENQAIAPGSQFLLGLHFKLEKGWHIYWQNPGDSGQPPRADWKLPAGFTAGEMQWPTPYRMGSPTIVDYGYSDEVTILDPMHAASVEPANQTAQIEAELKLLICREICIPAKAQVSLTIPVHPSATPNARAQALFTDARESLPRPAPASWKLRVSETAESFTVSASPGRSVKSVVFFPSHESEVENAAPQKLTSEGGGFRLTLQKSDELLKPIGRLRGVLVLDENKAYAMDVPVSHAAAPGTRGN